jgi:hypothetical protein
MSGIVGSSSFLREDGRLLDGDSVHNLANFLRLLINPHRKSPFAVNPCAIIASFWYSGDQESARAVRHCEARNYDDGEPPLDGAHRNAQEFSSG